MVNSICRRSQLYYALSLSLDWPSQDNLTALGDALACLNPEEPRLSAAFETLAQSSLEKIQAEYTGLFINGYPHTPCSPHESIYRDDSVLLGPAAEQVSVFYHQWGLHSHDQLPDHIAVELEFMHLLMQTMLVAIGPDQTDLMTVAQTFWNKHLGRWVKPFAKDLSNFARLEFYQALAERLLNFAETEQALWDDHLSHVCFTKNHNDINQSISNQSLESMERMS